VRNINVTGGGTPTGQAGAVRGMGLPRALLQFERDLRGALKGEGLLTRDSRMKERQEKRPAGRAQNVSEYSQPSNRHWKFPAPLVQSAGFFAGWRSCFEEMECCNNSNHAPLLHYSNN